MPGIYDSPIYYDIAFEWEGTHLEVDRFVACFDHAARPVRRVLEPGCGTGRLLRRFAARGYRVTGYDISPEAVAYARERIAEEGLGENAEAVLADMRNASFSEQFDAAFNAINTIGHVRTDEDVRAHFEATRASLAPGGVYVVQLACAWEDGPEPPDTWTCERDGIRIETTWSIEGEDRDTRLSRQRCRMEIEEDGRRFTIDERHDVRLWLDEDLVRITRAAGFERVAIHGLLGNRLPPEERITGQRGNLYHVFLRPRRP